MFQGLKENYKVAAWAFAIALLCLMPYIPALYWFLFIAFLLPFALTALAINLIFGYGGLLSFGHAGLFSIGMYTVAVLNYWYGIDRVETLLLGSIVASIMASLILGAICVRRSKIQFTILTLAFQQVLYGFFSIHPMFRAVYEAEGLPIFVGAKGHTTKILFYEFEGPGPVTFTQQIYYHYMLFFFTISVILIWITVNSPFGKTLQAIRDNELKAEFLGLRVRRQRLIAFIISGTFTGFAGALWGPMNTFATFDMSRWDIGLEFAFYPVLGGSRIFFGPIIGAYAYKLIHDLTWGYVPHWRLVMGVILIVTILRAPNGIMGACNMLSKLLYSKLSLNVEIIQIRKNPPERIAPDKLNEEYIVLKNKGRGRLRLKGWRVVDSNSKGMQKHSYVFPERLANGNIWTFDPGESIFLHTGKGEDKFLPRDRIHKPQFHFYWSRESFVWDNEEDIAYLFDERENLIHSLKVSSVTR